MTVLKADLGILLDHSQLQSALCSKYRFEYLPFYAEAAKLAGINVVFFSDRSLHENQAFIHAYQWDLDRQVYQKNLFEIPLVVHNRALLQIQEAREYRSFFLKNQTLLFNEKMRFDKWLVNRCLAKDVEIAKYVPKTAKLCSENQIGDWLLRYQTVYLKPRRGSLGLGVIRLRKRDQEIEVFVTRNKSSQSYLISADRLTDIWMKIGTKKYLIQEGIPLMELNQQPVDFRVSVQKGETGDWTVSGVVAKVGTPKAHATNLAVGGKAVCARKVITDVFGEEKSDGIYRSLKNAALQIAHKLENMDPHVADLGMDLTVTESEQIKFIEANGRDLRITFRNARQKKMWRRTFYNPVFYGAYLIRSREMQP